MMTIAQGLLQELGQESATTRRFLERIPADQLGWKPHEKSQTTGKLAMHIATIPDRIAAMAVQDECPPPDFGAGMPDAASVEELLSAHDASVAAASRHLGSVSNERMLGEWKLVAKGQVLMSMQRVVFCRVVLLNHLYHHRGQLGVYLRLLGAKVPWAYGPSGDEVPPEFEKVMEVMASA